MVKHIWLNMDISIPLLLDSTSKTKFYVDEITISISNIPVYIISSFEGNMPETGQVIRTDHSGLKRDAKFIFMPFWPKRGHQIPSYARWASLF